MSGASQNPFKFRYTQLLHYVNSCAISAQLLYCEKSLLNA